MHEDPDEQKDRLRKKPSLAPGSKIPSEKKEVTEKHVLIAVGQLFLTLFGILFSLRIPLPWIGKLILALVILFFGVRWILLTYRRNS